MTDFQQDGIFWDYQLVILNVYNLFVLSIWLHCTVCAVLWIP